METSVVLRAEGLRKRYRRGMAVDGVDLCVRAGERVGLLGPNGAGKTTTLLMLLGAVSPDSGTVEIAGHRLPKDRSAAVQNVGFAAGYLPLPDRMRVREHLALFANLAGMAKPGDRIDSELARWGISDLAGAMGTELSSGQKTLVGIVKATLHRPRVLVLDEPTNALDPEVAKRVRDGLLALCLEEGTALLITSHQMVEVERLCERVVFLLAGRVEADGTPTEVTRRYGTTDLEGVFLHLAAQRDAAGHDEGSRP